MGRNTSLAISRTASRGVQCSPASSLFSSLKRRTSSSKIVPMPVIVEAGMTHAAVGVLHRVGAQVDVGRGELLDQRAERIGLGEARDLVAELEAVEDVLHIGREAVEPGAEIGLELLSAGAGAQVAQGERGGIVEGLPRRLAQRRLLLDHAGLVERGLHVEDRPACRPPAPRPAGAARSSAGSRRDTCRVHRGRAARRRRCPRCSSRSSSGRRCPWRACPSDAAAVVAEHGSGGKTPKAK